MKSPTLSVVTCNYNHARFMPQAIESVVSQSRLPDEYILLDDGSTDNSVEIMESYAEKFPFIRVIRHERNAGIYNSLKELLNEARGSYWYSFAADDFLCYNGFFRDALQLAIEQPSAGIIFGELMLCDSDGANIRSYDIKHFHKLPGLGYLAAEEFLNVYLEQERPTHSFSGATIYRRACLDDVGGFRTELGSWTDTFALRAIGLKHGACFINQPCSVGRIMENGISGASKRNPQAMLDIVERATWLMRSTEFRRLFPEWHVRKWRAGFRDFVLDHCGGIESSYHQAGADYLRILDQGTPFDRRVGHALMKCTGLFRELQLVWLRNSLRRYQPDTSCYRDDQHRVTS